MGKKPAEEKLRIVLEGMQTGMVADVCRKYGISSANYYGWKHQLMASAKQIYARKKSRRNKSEEKLARENARLKEVIAEITSENLELKKRDE